MRLLLDTHIWLWAVGDPSRLSRRVIRALHDDDAEIWLSPISVWETLLLAEGGRLALDPSPDAWLDARLRSMPLRDAPVTREVARMSRSVDLPHKDPADRFIAATAVVYDLTLVTADERLETSTRYRVMPNR